MHGGKRLNSGAKVGAVKQMMIDNGTPDLIVKQLHERLESGEVDTKELISLLGYFVAKLKHVELTDATEEPQQLDASAIWLKSLEND